MNQSKQPTDQQLLDTIAIAVINGIYASCPQELSGHHSNFPFNGWAETAYKQANAMLMIRNLNLPANSHDQPIPNTQK